MKTTQGTITTTDSIETAGKQAAIQELLFFAQQTQRATQQAAGATLDAIPLSVQPSDTGQDVLTPSTGLSKNGFRRL